METNKRQALLVALSRNGKWIAWWDEEPRNHVYDIATGKEVASFKAGEMLFCLYWGHSAMRFMPDGTLLALNAGSHLYRWHPEKGLKTREFDPVASTMSFGRIAPDGKNAVVWDWDHGTALQLFDLETFDLEITTLRSAGLLCTVAFIPRLVEQDQRAEQPDAQHGVGTGSHPAPFRCRVRVHGPRVAAVQARQPQKAVCRTEARKIGTPGMAAAHVVQGSRFSPGSTAFWDKGENRKGTNLQCSVGPCRFDTQVWRLPVRVCANLTGHQPRNWTATGVGRSFWYLDGEVTLWTSRP